MEKKMTSEEYNKHIEKLKKKNGVKRISVPMPTKNEVETQLGIFFEKGTEIEFNDGKIYVSK